MNKLRFQRCGFAIALALACSAGFAQGVGATGAAAGPGGQSRGDRADCQNPGATSGSSCADDASGSAMSARSAYPADSASPADLGESRNGWDRTTGNSRSRASNSTGNNSTGTDDSSNENNKSGGQ